MKCLKCNSSITENQLNCPGCGTSIEELKQNNLLLLEDENKEEIVKGFDDVKEAETKSEHIDEVNSQEPIQTVDYTKTTKSKTPLLIVVFVLVFLVLLLGVSYCYKKSKVNIYSFN